MFLEPYIFNIYKFFVQILICVFKLIQIKSYYAAVFIFVYFIRTVCDFLTQYPMSAECIYLFCHLIAAAYMMLQYEMLRNHQYQYDYNHIFDSYSFTSLFMPLYSICPSIPAMRNLKPISRCWSITPDHVIIPGITPCFLHADTTFRQLS